MYKIALVIGIYSYAIFLFGILALINKPVMAGFSILYFIIVLIILKKEVYEKIALAKKFVLFNSLNFFNVFIYSLIFLQMIINFIGVLGPEHAFDALWYHLTLPKLYVQNQQIIFFPGWLLYYSAMPKLTEMLYTVGLLFGNETVGKIIHFAFGILTLLTIYNFSKKFLNQKEGLLAGIIFYSNLVVGWMSITAYIDLARTFFELLSFCLFFQYIKSKQIKYFIISAVLLGLTISTKLISIGSLIIFYALMVAIFKNNIKKIFIYSLCFSLIALTITMPWFIYSFIYTNNPIYPIFSGYPLENNFFTLINPLNFIKDLWIIFTQAPDPINPIYIIVFPLSFIVFKKFDRSEKLLILYSLISVIVWYLTPQTGGGRFILPYLPVFSIVVLMIIKKIKYLSIKKLLIYLIIFFSLTSIIYRGIANSKYLSVITGREKKSDFLSKHLIFTFGDFYDIDGFISKTIKKTDRVLIFGVHNLYYVNFPFIHESFYKPGDKFNYILVSNDKLPQKYSNWILIYQNNLSNVKLYRQPS